MTSREKMLTIGLASALVFASIAGAAAFISHNDAKTVSSTDTVKKSQHTASKQDLPWLDKQPVHKSAAPRQQMASAQPACNDGNVLGTVAGGVAGGALSSTIGKGTGKTAATIAGTMGGAYLGNQYIPLQNTLCR